MANQEHLERMKQGTDIWNSWRKQHPEVRADLSEAYLSGANLSEAYLFLANLSGADLSRANLSEANLSGANLSKAKLSRADLSGANLSGANLSGANLSGANLSEAKLFRADLSGAKLFRVNLSGADLSRADLSRANLSGAKLFRANLSGADLSRADLSAADLNGADLSAADLNEANLNEANLNEANLFRASLYRTSLSGANLSGARALFTAFADVDLSMVRGLTTMKHLGPSSIGIDTIYRSQGKIPERFLLDAGIPHTFLASIHSLVGQPIQYFTCFISHSTKDKHFCDRFYADLRSHDVPSWYLPEDATVWGEIDRSIKVYDKLVVVCSEHSLQSGPVLREIERALQREDRQGKHILFPLPLDNYLFEQWEHKRKVDVVSKVAGDFRDWESSAEKYDHSFQRLLNALKAQETTTS